MNYKNTFKILLSLVLSVGLLVGQLPLFPQQSAEASTDRIAKIMEVTGKAMLIKSGGAKSFRAYPGMALRQGDRIITEAYSSVLVKVMDTSDEITIAERTDFFFTDLHDESGNNITRFKIGKGSVWTSVTSLVHSKDVFEIESPVSRMSARGTNFFVAVDPATGYTRMAVISGVVQESRTTEQGGFSTIMPTRGSLLFREDRGGQNHEDNENIIDPEQLIKSMDPSIIAAILKSKADIDRENLEYISQLQNAMKEKNTAKVGGLTPSEQESLDRLVNNLENIIGNILKSALGNRVIDKDVLNELIRIENEKLGKPIDLNNVKPLNLTIQETAKQAAIRKLEEDKLEQEKEKERNVALEKKLKEQQIRLLEQNAKAQKEAEDKIKAMFLMRLDGGLKAAFEERYKQLEAEKKKQDDAAARAKAGKENPSQPTPPATIPEPNLEPTPNPEPTPLPAIDQKLAETKLSVPSDLTVYKEQGVRILQDALALPETTKAEKEFKIIKILDAIASLEINIITPEIPEITGFGTEVGPHFIQAWWDLYEGVVKYQVYIDGSKVRDITEIEGKEELHFSTDELTAGTAYLLEIIGLNAEGKTVAIMKHNFQTEQQPD